jgi:hypothetical protein
MKKRKACVLDIDMVLPSVMLSNVQWKKIGCHLYAMKKRKACVLDIDKGLPSVILSNVQWKRLWVSSIWHEEQEGICTGY